MQWLNDSNSAINDEKWCTSDNVGDFVICFLMLERQSDSK